MIVAFLIWCAVGCLLIGIGIFDCFSKKQVGFWANAKSAEMKDVPKYNKAVGRLFCGFGLGFILLGLPLLAGENSPLIFISMIGVMFEVMILIVVYVTCIENKYKK